MNILITGGNGFLGRHLITYLHQYGYNVFATGRGQSKNPFLPNEKWITAELTNEAEVQTLVKTAKPSVIIHTAAISKPDECLLFPEKCIANNITATAHLLHACQENNVSKFLFISTDFVFGENGPHAETDETQPLNFYGESKLKAEELVKNSGLNYCIIRPVFIYGEVWQNMRSTFLHWVKTNLENGNTIKVVSDQLRTPTYVYDICAGIQTVIAKDKQGIFHLAGKDILSPYNMALTVAAILQLNSSFIQNVTSDTFNEPVIRAKRSGLKIDKAIAELNYQPLSFEEGVRKTFNLP